MKRGVLAAAAVLAMPVAARTVNVAQYGAVPNDGKADQGAFAAAFATVVAAGGGEILVPPGDFQFDARIAVDLASSHVELLGEGAGDTRIVCDNPAGLFWFDNSANDNELVVKNLSLMAGFPDSGTNLVGYGTALQIDNPSLCTNDAVCNLLMENVAIMPPDWSFHAYFARSVYTSFLQNPRFVSVMATGPYGPAAPKVPAESGFRINYGNNPFFENCYSKNKQTGYLLANVQGNVVFDRCIAVDVDTGFKVDSTSEYCAAENRNFHVNARYRGIDLYNLDRVLLQHGAPYWDNSDGIDYTDFSIDNCSDVEIAGNMFHVHYTVPQRTLIHLKNGTSNVLIKHNIYNARGYRVVKDADVSDVVETQNIDLPAHIW